MTIGCLVIPLLMAVGILAVALSVRANASDRLVVPARKMVLVRAAPDEAAPLLARFGAGRALKLTGRSGDWRWLQVELWDGRQGWALRPLDVLVWRIEAAEIAPGPPAEPPPAPTPVPVEMIALPATAFTMGSPPGLGDADETPAHVVRLSPFEIDRTEVTVGQYWQCVEAAVCASPTGDASQTEPHYLNDPAFDNYPVIHIPWTEANRYCNWRGKRLPTEAEWEMAAGWDAERGAKLQWPWGNEPVVGQANVGEASLGAPAVVGSFPADRSPSGVLDMAGNVREWVFDWYKVDYYRVADDTDPVGPTNRRGAGTGRVLRGGSYLDPLAEARTANRGHDEETYGYATVGFRCARDLGR